MLVRTDGVEYECVVEDTLAPSDALALISHIVTIGDRTPPQDSLISWPARAAKVMAEYMCDDPVWDLDGPVRLERLGVSSRLVDRLRAWNEEFNGIALTDYQFTSTEEETRWESRGVQLAYELQNELPDFEVSYANSGDSRHAREHHGRSPHEGISG